MGKYRYIVIVVSVVCSFEVSAMGIRAFVALPLEEGGTVLRFLGVRNFDNDIDTLNTNVVYGLSGNQALFFSMPYRLSPTSGDRNGDLSVLYRHTAWQLDTLEGTSRFAFLGGGVIPTKNERDGAIQAGAVTTFYRKRYEWDLNILWQQGLGSRLDAGRYDIAWQYRLSPGKFPDWGIVSEWDIDLELGGRWVENNTMVHQATVGLQYINKRWVAEAAVVQDLNAAEETRLILSTRLHF